MKGKEKEQTISGNQQERIGSEGHCNGKGWNPNDAAVDKKGQLERTAEMIGEKVRKEGTKDIRRKEENIVESDSGATCHKKSHNI